MHFRLPNLENYSFWLGFILASLFWWAISIIRLALQQIHTNSGLKASEKKERNQVDNGIEERYRRMVFLHAQALHLAAPLFSLGEILEQPKFLAPPPHAEPGASAYTEDIVELTLPYLPAWPELAAIYRAPTLTLSQALSGNSDLILVGQAGMGKTVALASIASLLANRDLESVLPTDRLPFLIHVADVDFPINKKDPLCSIISFFSERASGLDLPHLPDFISRTFSKGNAILLLDGTDELAPDGLKELVDFIQTIKRTFPGTRIITCATNEYLDGLGSLNFITLAIASWDSDQRINFLERWGNQWIHHVAGESLIQNNNQVDPLLLNGWTSADSLNLTPLELTLKVWAAYAGDIRGPHALDAIETHILRISPPQAPRKALESLALRMTLSINPFFDPTKAQQWVSSFEPNNHALFEELGHEEKKENRTGNLEGQKTPPNGLIVELVQSGLLRQHSKNRMRFIHPVFAGYLAGKPLENYTDTVLDQPPWVGKHLAMSFLAALGEATSLSNKLLSQMDRPFSKNLLLAAHWFRYSPDQTSWRSQIMVKLAELLKENGQPLGLRGQALAALVQSGDPAAAVLFHQLLTENDPEILQMASLGSGALGDVKFVELLSALLKYPNSKVRCAACLALAAIGSATAMDAVASALLQGDEILRLAAARAMANHNAEGHAMLREGARMKENLEVRRAVAFGLGFVHQPWADEILNKLQDEDDQWVVRNAASEMLEDRRKPDIHMPKRFPPASESPWLIAFAGKEGMGISPDIQPTDLLLRALNSDDPEVRLASLDYLRKIPVEGVFSALYQAMYGGEPELREAVYLTLTEMAACGMNIPDPVQFGVGS